MSVRSLVERQPNSTRHNAGSNPAGRANSVTAAQGLIPRQAEHGTGGILRTGYARSARRKPARIDRQRTRFFPMAITRQRVARPRGNKVASIGHPSHLFEKSKARARRAFITPPK